MNIADAAITPNISKRNQGEPYLKIQLNERFVAGISMKHALEVVVVPAGRITPIPKMPTFTLGLLNQRSKVFWVVDLAEMIELPCLNKEQPNYNVAIVRVNNIPLGLAVKEVTGIIRFNPDYIQSPLGTVASGLIPYLKGCVLQQQNVVLILDPEAIVNSFILQNNY